ncbi:MAG TPA: serine/threonine-protein kinase [Polyangiaceae bacterium]|nr:serine/threonine-protein kinase [Polyangiaceae bacterium]
MAEDVFGIVGSLQAAVFRVERVVAEGGFGVVYRAHHEGFKAAVALKCLKIPGAFSAEQRQAFLQKFQEEGEVLFRLSALIPSVVRPLHVGTLETSKHPFVPFIALEWLDGESLDSVIERRRAAGKPPLDLARVVRMMGSVARGLECAHKFPGPGGAQLSILHRDLKPENLFLAKVHGQETLKILDFGIGKVRSAATQMVGRVSAEQGGIAAFTPAYGAPEQWLPKRYGQTGPWTDVWGFALCAVEALTNRAPFEGDAPAVMGACINEQERPTPLAFGVKVADRAEAAFRKALAVDPVNRFQDIGAFWDELEAASGLVTPRITVTQTMSHDSMPPPADVDAGQPSSLLTEVDATKRVPGAQPFPELTLGLPPPAPPKSVGTKPSASASVKQPVSQAARGRRALDDADDEDGMHISVMRNDAPQGLTSAPGARSSPRGASPELGASPRVARAAAPRAMPSEAPTMDTVLMRMMPALKLIGVGVAIMIADVAYATHNGEAFRVGPARALWIAGPLVGYGVVRLVLSLVQ